MKDDTRRFFATILSIPLILGAASSVHTIATKDTVVEVVREDTEITEAPIARTATTTEAPVPAQVPVAIPAPKKPAPVPVAPPVVIPATPPIVSPPPTPVVKTVVTQKKKKSRSTRAS